MAIPESQFETWSHQGSISQSSLTYNSIKNVLESSDSPYAERNYTVFLQGSYGNNTNIFSESDVDIVIRLNSCFYHDLESLPENQKEAFKIAHNNASFGLLDFKKAVLAQLQQKYGNSVIPGSKAIKIKGNGNRRNADVLVTTEYRRYFKFLSTQDEKHISGICFYSSDKTRIANYPQQHRTNCTAKHQAAIESFKPMVRIFKNLRTRLVEEKMIEEGLAPSYYLEGLLYNVPNEMFTKNYTNSFINCFNWLLSADRNKFVCANEQFYLLRENSHVTWQGTKCEKFLSAASDLWEQW